MYGHWHDHIVYDGLTFPPGKTKLWFTDAQSAVLTSDRDHQYSTQWQILWQLLTGLRQLHWRF